MDQEVLGRELQKFNITDSAIVELSSRYLSLTIQGLEDREGYRLVHEARMDVKGRRVQVQKTGKELREEAVVWQKAVIAEEKRIVSLLEPIEKHLSDEEQRIDDGKQAIKDAEARALALKVKDRVDKLCAFGAQYNGKLYFSHGIIVLPDTIREASDADFEALVGQIQEQIDLENKKAQAETEARAAEEVRLRKVREEQEAEQRRLEETAQKQREEEARIKAEQEEAARKLREEKDALEREKKRLADEAAARLKAVEDEKKRIETEKVRAQELDVARREAAEKALRAAEEKARKEQEAQAKKAALEARKAARRPDKVKLREYVDTIFSLPAPEMKTDDGKAMQKRIDEELADLNGRLLIWIEEL